MKDFIFIEGVNNKLLVRTEDISSLYYPGTKTITVVVGRMSYYIDLETEAEAYATYNFVKNAVEAISVEGDA